VKNNDRWLQLPQHTPAKTQITLHKNSDNYPRPFQKVYAVMLTGGALVDCFFPMRDVRLLWITTNNNQPCFNVWSTRDRYQETRSYSTRNHSCSLTCSYFTTVHTFIIFASYLGKTVLCLFFDCIFYLLKTTSNNQPPCFPGMVLVPWYLQETSYGTRNHSTSALLNWCDFSYSCNTDLLHPNIRSFILSWDGKQKKMVFEIFHHSTIVWEVTCFISSYSMQYKTGDMVSTHNNDMLNPNIKFYLVPVEYMLVLIKELILPK